MTKMPRGKDRERSECEKLRDMTFKEKLDYIWAYFNYHIIGGAITIIVIVSLLTTCLSKSDVGLFIEWNGAYIEQAELETICEVLGERLFVDGDTRLIEAALFLSSPDDPSFMMQYFQRLAAIIAAGAVDIFILNSSQLEEYSYWGYLMPLENTLSDIESADSVIYNLITDEAVTAVYSEDGETSLEQIMGIRVSDSPFFAELPVDLYIDIYFCIAITTKNYDNTVRALCELFR